MWHSSQHIYPFLAFAYYASSQSVTSLDAASCIDSPLKTFSACNWFYSRINYCASPQVSSTGSVISCYCNQPVFNAIFDCESEMRLCDGNDNSDGDMQVELQIWNSACNGVLSFSPTTPILSSLSTTYDEEFCTSVFSSCQAVNVWLQSCSVNYAGNDVQKYSSCHCAPQLLSAEYTCSFLGNTSCLAAPATLTNLEQYSYCDNFLSVLGGGSRTAPLSISASLTVGSSVTTSLTSETSVSPQKSVSSQASALVTTPALPGLSPSGSGPIPSSTRSSGAREKINASLLIALAIWTFLSTLT